MSNDEFDPAPQFTKEEEDELFQKIVRFLIDGGNLDEARLLMSCEINIYKDYVEYDDDWGRSQIAPNGHTIQINAQRKAYDRLKDLEYIKSRRTIDLDGCVTTIDAAYLAFLDGPNVYRVRGNASVDLSPGWRERLYELVESGGIEVSNQGLGAEKSDYFKLWQSLKFRSSTEQRVAEELDRLGIMFFPNCTARLGMRNERKNKEADFLVCYKGKWGILEVDGPHHTGRADLDHDRDRLFKQHGIVIIEHFNHEECYKNTAQVVGKFLGILERVK